MSSFGLKSIRDLSFAPGTPVLVRASLNTPLSEGVVSDDYRLRRAVPTLRFLAERGAKVIVISHVGELGTETLKPAAAVLQKELSQLSFFDETISKGARDAIRAMAPGDILVLENLRRDKREKENDPTFAAELASLADVFVQDAFDTCHRNHASIVGVPKLLPSYAGLLLEEEILALSAARVPNHPALAIVGGAKFSTKEPVLEKLCATYDHVFVGGALANDFLKAVGHEVGKSLISGASGKKFENIRSCENLILPVDARVVSASEAATPTALMSARIVSVDAVLPDDVILDVGPETLTLLEEYVANAKTVLWNGPLGAYERGFSESTLELARLVASSSAHSVVGGGDTVDAIEESGLMHRFSFVSTGGGSMLDFLAHGTLPGIEALSQST